MSALPPIITDWELKGLEWQYIHQISMKALQLTPKQEVIIPYQREKYEFDEIVLIDLSVQFDSPKMAIRLWGDPAYDSKEIFRTELLMLVLDRVSPNVYCSIPPITPPGLFVINIVNSYKYENFLQISVINTDADASHWLLGIGYDLCVLRKKGTRQKYLDKYLSRP